MKVIRGTDAVLVALTDLRHVLQKQGHMDWISESKNLLYKNASEVARIASSVKRMREPRTCVGVLCLIQWFLTFFYISYPFIEQAWQIYPQCTQWCSNIKINKLLQFRMIPKNLRLLESMVQLIYPLGR